MTISAEQRTSRQHSHSARSAPVRRSRVSGGLRGTRRATWRSCLHRPEHPGLSPTTGHEPRALATHRTSHHAQSRLNSLDTQVFGTGTSSSTTERRSRRRGGCSASTRPRRAAPDCPLRGHQATDSRCGPEAIMPATSKLPSRRLHPDATSRDVVGLMRTRRTKASLNPRVVAHLRDARRGWPSAADTDELGVALRHERWTIWGSASAVSAAPADQFCKSSISAASLSVGRVRAHWRTQKASSSTKRASCTTGLRG